MFNLTIETRNEAFCDTFLDGGDQGDPSEVSRILRSVAATLEAGKFAGACMDSNGNKVGSFEFTE